MRHFILVVGMAVLYFGCASRRELIQSENKVMHQGVVSLSADWVKPKGKKYDVRFNIANESGKEIIIMLDDLQCYRGSAQGELKHTFYNTGERTIDLRAKQQKGFNLVCRLGAEAKGDYRVVVSRVFENPSSDGKTTGNVMAKDIEWKLSDKDKD